MYFRITISLVLGLCLMNPVFADDTSMSSVPLIPKLMMMSIGMIVRPRPEVVIEQVSSQIELTRDQRQKLLAILDKYEQSMQPLGQQYYESLDALRSMVYASDKDGAKLREATDKAMKAEAAFVSAEVEFWVQMKAVLTDAQLSKLQEVLSKPLVPVGQSPSSTGTSSNVPAASATPAEK